MTKRQIVLVILIQMSPTGCSGDGGRAGQSDGLSVHDGGQSSDGGAGPGDDGGNTTCLPCGANQICVNGACQDLPPQCPCPTGAYSDLTTNQCKPGCDRDTSCPTGRYCDLSTRRCSTGCRGAEDCPAPNNCENHRCFHDCNTPCPPDGDPCTSDDCINETCPYAPAPNGTACESDSNECTEDVCQSGLCAHPPVSNGTACTMGGVPCMSAACQNGSCSHSPVVDGTDCGANSFCRASMCQQPVGTCKWNATMDGYTIWTQTGSTTDTNCSCITYNGVVYLGNGGNVTALIQACNVECKENTVSGYRVLCW